MNKVILFNEAHLGDIFFSVEIIKNIVNCNPHLKISVMNKYNAYYLYSNINNIESFLTPTCYEKSKVAWEMRNDIILINMWCVGGEIKSNSIIPSSQQNRIIKIIDQINSKYKNINFKYNSLTKSELIPKLKLSTIPDSVQKKLNNNEKRIFYYNVRPRSGQYHNRNLDHDNNIIKLCNEYKEYSIIIPKSTILTYPNLICLDNEGIIEKPDAENVVQYAQIARSCQHIILYDCGACFLSLVDNNNHLYIVKFESKVSFSDIMHQRKLGNKLSKLVILDKNLIRIII